MARLNLLTEGEVDASAAHIADLKNHTAKAIMSHLENSGFSDMRFDRAVGATGESIAYADIAQGQTLMVRVLSDDDIKIQLPVKAANILGLKDIYSIGSAAEAVAIINLIRSKI